MVLIHKDELSPGVLLSFMLYQGQLQEYFQNFFNSWTSLIKSGGNATTIFEYIERVPKYCFGENWMTPNMSDDYRSNRKELKKSSEKRSDLLFSNNKRIKMSNDSKYKSLDGSGIPADYSFCSLRFDSVSFNYPSRPDVKTINDLNFVIRNGQFVALVGGSGAGKSTIMHLLQHFYEPQRGRISIKFEKTMPNSSDVVNNNDSHDKKNSMEYDIHELDHEYLHGCILGIVEQNPTLINGTIEDNLFYGIRNRLKSSLRNKDCTLSKHDNNENENDADYYYYQREMIRCCKLCNIHDFIMHQLPNQYQTTGKLIIVKRTQ